MRKRPEKIEVKTRKKEKYITRAKGGRAESNNEEGQETRRHKTPGKGNVREDQVQNIFINTAEI